MTDPGAQSRSGRPDPGEQVERALDLLANAIGLATSLLRGLGNRAARARLADLAQTAAPEREPDRTAQAIVRFAARVLAEPKRVERNDIGTLHQNPGGAFATKSRGDR